MPVPHSRLAVCMFCIKKNVNMAATLLVQLNLLLGRLCFPTVDFSGYLLLLTGWPQVFTWQSVSARKYSHLSTIARVRAQYSEVFWYLGAPQLPYVWVSWPCVCDHCSDRSLRQLFGFGIKT